MTEDHNARRDAYDRTRSAFDALALEDRARFLIEATASTVASGVDRAGRAAADELDDLFADAGRRRERSDERDAATDGPGPAEPETGRQQAGGASADENGNAGKRP